MTPETRTVEANGLRFAYFEQGQGPLVLMLHGFPDTPHTWDDVRPKVAAKGYRVVTPFMRGYRPTALPPRDTDNETLARDAIALVGALGAEQAILVGHDWGAAATYGAAALAPEKFAKIVTVGIPHPGAMRPSPRLVWGVRHFFTNKLPGAAGRFAAHDFAALRAIYARWSPTWNPDDSELAPVKECFADPASCEAAFGYYRALSFVVPAFLKRHISVPTVVFSGKDDPVTRLSDYQGAQRLFDGPYAIEETPGGHFLHREVPDLFAARLIAHL